MQYILIIIVASCLVAGQSLWKVGFGALQSGHTGLLHKAVAILTQPQILLGLVIYGFATVLYIYVIGKYEYGVSYALIVSLSLIGATVVAQQYFGEKIGPINYLGVGIVLVGVALILKK